MERDEKFLLDSENEKKYAKKYIKKDEREDYMKSMIKTLKRTRSQVSDEEMELIWTTLNTMLKQSAKYVMLKGLHA